MGSVGQRSGFEAGAAFSELSAAGS
jgi:hypothetical protein